jgi:hypothetical protein
MFSLTNFCIVVDDHYRTQIYRSKGVIHMQTKLAEDALGSSYKDAVQTKMLLLCGMIAGPLFTLAWIVEGATRANYHPLRHPVSSLALVISGGHRSPTSSSRVF